MADNRIIHSAVRIGDEVYGPGREDDLSEKMTKEQLKHLTEQGAIEGDFKAMGVAVEKTEAPGTPATGLRGGFPPKK